MEKNIEYKNKEKEKRGNERRKKGRLFIYYTK